MASRFVENVHATRLQGLIDELGIECTRTPELSLSAEESEEASIEEQDQQEEETKVAQDEELLEEEESTQLEEELFGDDSGIFPGPSLRKHLSDKVRKYEEQNRIHVLPVEFKTNIDPASIPKIAQTAPQKYIDILADIIGCKQYKTSLAEYWILDTLANLLRRAQDDSLNRSAQATLILWFCEWMKEIQNFDAADRQRMLRRFKDNMLASARFIAEEERLPTPGEAGIFYKATDDSYESRYTVSTLTAGMAISKMDKGTKPMPMQVSFASSDFACSLIEMTKIFHYIYDLFSTDYQFDLVRSVFTFTPDYTLLDMPSQLQNPKTIYTTLKVKVKKEKSPKKETKLPKGKKKEPDTQEYLALMELKAKEERELDEQEERDRQDYHLRSHILPLNFAATDELFDKYWPPPPMPEPEPEPEPELKPKKGKGKK